MPIDPVCGIELDEDLAVPYEYKNKKLHFCCNACRKLFIKKPGKFKKNI